MAEITRPHMGRCFHAAPTELYLIQLFSPIDMALLTELFVFAVYQSLPHGKHFAPSARSQTALFSLQPQPLHPFVRFVSFC